MSDHLWTVPCDRCYRQTADPWCCDHGIEHCPDCRHINPCHHCAREMRDE